MALAMTIFVMLAGQTSAQSTGSDWTVLGSDYAGGNGATSTVVGDTYVLPSSGVEVIIGEGVEADDPAGTDVEDQIVVYTPDGFGAVAAIPAVGHPVRSMEAYIGGFGESMDAVEELDLQENRERALGIYRVEDGGTTSYLVISVDAGSSPGNHIIEVAIAESESLEVLIADLTANVSIDGVAMFGALDVPGVMDIVARDTTK